MESKILTETQERSIRAQLKEAGYTDVEKILATAQVLFARVDPMTLSGISLSDGNPGESVHSTLVFVDKGDGDYQHYLTTATWHWPSPILHSGQNIVGVEYYAERGKIPAFNKIKKKLMTKVGWQNKADKAMLTEPLKSDLDRLGIPGSTSLMASQAWIEGPLFLEAERDIRVPGTEIDIHLDLRIIAQLAASNGSPPFIVQISVNPEQPKGLTSSDALKPLGRLRYHFANGPIPDIGKIQQDVQSLLALLRSEISQNDQKARQIARKRHPPGTSPNRRNRPRH